jgi:hypothetical protein
MTRALVVASAALLAGCFSPRIQNGGFSCSMADPAPCPSGFSCVAAKCVMSGDGGVVGSGVRISIDKTGTYRGVRLDPGLSTTADCPDQSLEPNDGPGPAPFGPPILLTPVADEPTPRVRNMAICPAGHNPATQQHDVDWFKLDIAEPVTIVAEAFYDIAHGDLDLAIVDASSKVLVSDGSAVSNACAATGVAAGTYYVVVVGADDYDVNHYELSVRSYGKSMSCGASDLGPAHD